MNNVTIEREFVTWKGDVSFIGSKIEYHFVLLDEKIYLESIRVFERESARHRWKLNRVEYSRLSYGRREVLYMDRTEHSALSMVPEEVKLEAVDKIRFSIKLTNWSKA